MRSAAWVVTTSAAPAPAVEAPVEAVAAGDAAGGVDEDGLRDRAVGVAAGAPWRSPAGRAGRAGCGRRGATPRPRRGRGRAAGRRRAASAWRELSGRSATQRRRVEGAGRVAQNGQHRREPRRWILPIDKKWALCQRRAKDRGEVHGTQSADAGDRRRAADAARRWRRISPTSRRPSRRTRPGWRRTAATSATTRPASPPARPRSTSRSSSAQIAGGQPEAAARTILVPEHPRRHVRAGLPDRDALRGGLRARGGGGQAGRDRPAAALRDRRADGARRRSRSRGRRPTGKRVAVVGAGPAGLACAHRLAMLGHAVALIDAREKGGGLNEFGIAAYKAVEGFAQAEVDWLLGIGGITVEYGRRLGRRRDARDAARGLSTRSSSGSGSAGVHALQGGRGGAGGRAAGGRLHRRAAAGGRSRDAAGRAAGGGDRRRHDRGRRRRCRRRSSARRR